MDRGFEEVCKELAHIHTREIQELKEKTDTWRDRFERLKAQKQKCQDEYQAQRVENKSLHKEVTSLLDTIGKLHTRDITQKCTVCETLQKSLDALRESYSQSLREKDQVIAFLDSRLSEVSGGESFLPKLKLRFSTPHKQDGGGSGSYRPPSDRKQSPDSTIRTTPSREPEDVRDEDTEKSQGGQNKGTKLCLQRRLKRHRYTERVSPELKRRKLVKKQSSENQEKEKVLVPETCDPDIQSDGSAGSERISLDKKFQSPTILYRHRDKNEERAELNNGNCDIQTIPETLNMFGMCDSSSEEESDTQSTVKRAPGDSYSLRSVLCSPPSSDDDEYITDMSKVVNHRTLQLSGQSVVVETEHEAKHGRSVESGMSRLHDVDTVVNGDVQNIKGDHGKIPERSSDVVTEVRLATSRDAPTEKQDREWTETVKSFCLKPHRKATSPENREGKVQRKKSPDLEREKASISLETNDAEADSPSASSPVFKVRPGGKYSPEMKSSANFQDGVSKTDRKEEFESPSLLRVASKVDDDVTIIDSPRSQGQQTKMLASDKASWPQGRNMVDHDDNEEESPILVTSRSKVNSENVCIHSNLSGSKSTTTKTLIVKSPKKKSLKFCKGSKVELDSRNNESVASRQLRQTTLSQVFNNGSHKARKKGKKTDSQEEEDLEKAIQLSLKEIEFQCNHGSDLTEVEESTKENTPPFKKPEIPIKKTRNRHSSSESPRKGQRLPGKESVKLHNKWKGQRSRRSHTIDLDETMPPPSGLRSSSQEKSTDQQQARHGNCSSVTGDRDLDTNVNGSIDPGMQLSLLCDDDFELILENDLVKKKLSFAKHTGGKTEEDTLKAHHFDSENIADASLNDSVATLKDFRIEDLGRGGDVARCRAPMTSTCIEENSQGLPCSSVSVKFGSRKKRAIVTGTSNMEDTKTNEGKDELDDHAPVQPLDDSFDHLPKKPGTGYAYVDVVRKHKDRRNLIGYECKECYEYYTAMGLGEEEVRQRIQTCSRHRAHYVPPNTPPHFWSIGFPDTQECEERGYIRKEEDVEDMRPAFRRRRKLKQIFKSKNQSRGEEKEDSDSDK